MRYVFLPGLDGTGDLFLPLVKLWTDPEPPIILSYPTDRFLGYRELESFILPQLPKTESYVLVAESFGGPLAIRLAARGLPALRGLVLSATFVRQPRGRLGAWGKRIIGPWLFRDALPKFIGQLVLKWQGLSEEQIQWLENVLAETKPEVLAARLDEALDVNALRDLRALRVPVLCLYAKRDLVLAERCHELIAEANPHVQVVGLDVPHFLLQTQPAEALRLIQAFAKPLETPAKIS